MKRIGGTIENWQVVDWLGQNVVIGNIFGDDHWKDGTSIRTSTILTMSETEVETLNTIYKLGTPKQ
jgi:hypothetical protein